MTKNAAATTNADDKELTDIGGILSGYIGIKLTNEQVADLLAQDADGELLLCDVREWGASDTEVRGGILSLLSRRLMDRAWPLGYEKIDIKQFQRELNAKAEAAGYEVTDYARSGL